MRKLFFIVYITALLMLSVAPIFGQEGGNQVRNIPELSSVEGLDDFFFSVQVGVFYEPKSRDQLLNIEDLYYTKKPNGNWRYVSGIYTDRDEAVEARERIVSRGIRDAFIVVFNRGRTEAQPGVAAQDAGAGYSSYKLDSLIQIINSTKAGYRNLADSLNLTIKAIKAIKAEKVTTGSSGLSSLFYWLIVAFAILIAIVAIVLYMNMRKKLKARSESVQLQIEQAKQIFADEIDRTRQDLISQNNQTKKLFMLNRMISSLPLGAIDGREAGLSEEEMKKLLRSGDGQDPDHSFPLKLAREIFDMRKRLDSLPSDTPGRDRLEKIVARVESQFNESDYKIINHQGENYEDSMPVVANFVPTERLEPGERIITNVVKPQVNFRGETVQQAVVDVSTGKDEITKE